MFSPIAEILEELRQGRMIVLTDDESRENEGDLVCPAQFMTPERVTFMLQNALGYMCLSLTEADCDRLNLHPQSAVNTTVRGTPFTVSIDLHPRHGGTTGVSAKERAKCIQMAIDPRYSAEDFVRPGHINPLRSRDGGVLVRTGQTEGSLDLCRLAGLYPAAVIIEIMKPDGEMARVPDLVQFCKQHNLKMCSVAQIIEHRLKRESMVRRVQPFEGRPLHTAYGTFNTLLFQSVVDPLPHLVLTAGGIGRPSGPGASEAAPTDKPTLVRMHRRHLLGDVFGSIEAGAEAPSGETLRASMRAIQAEGSGAIVYLRTNNPADEAASLEAMLQSLTRPRDANTPDLEAAHPQLLREYGVGGQILRNLGLSRLRLLTNSSTELPGLDAFGLSIVERVPVSVTAAR